MEVRCPHRNGHLGRRGAELVGAAVNMPLYFTLRPQNQNHPPELANHHPMSAKMVSSASR